MAGIINLEPNIPAEELGLLMSPREMFPNIYRNTKRKLLKNMETASKHKVRYSEGQKNEHGLQNSPRKVLVFFPEWGFGK